MHTRNITKNDFDHIVSVMDQWWGGTAGQRPEPFLFYEFGQHALVVEDEGTMAGFLLGFVSDQASPTAYVHLVGIHPDYRRKGVARKLYDTFLEQSASRGALHAKAITTVGNEGSVLFHKAMGFEVAEVEDYAGPGRARYVFSRRLTPRPKSNVF